MIVNENQDCCHRDMTEKDDNDNCNNNSEHHNKNEELLVEKGSLMIAAANDNEEHSSTTKYHNNNMNFNTKLSFVLTGCMLLFFVTMGVYYNMPSIMNNNNNNNVNGHERNVHRFLADDNNNDNNDNNNNDNNDNNNNADNNNNNNNNNSKDYSSYSCHYLYDITPDSGDDQCAFARTCNYKKGVWAPWVYCRNKHLSTAWLFGIISPFITLWLVVLFRLLGTTAEDYFSPSLEMFSMKMGLPPRFAGVTLLALGNGAADVSATVNAISSDKESGYLLSLGALTGAAMFVGGVVAAVVVIVAGGVPCRGALVRDVLALAITVVVTWVHLSSGEIGPEAISVFLTLYGVFVVLVLVADVYHRSIVLPRLDLEARQSERERQFDEERRVSQMAGDAMNQLADGLAASTTAGGGGSEDSDDQQVPLSPQRQRQTQQQQQQQQHRKNPFSTILTAISNYDNTSQQQQQNNQHNSNQGWGVESDDLAHERPVMLHGAHGILHGDVGAASTSVDNSAIELGGERNTNAEGNTIITDSPYSILQGTNSDDAADGANGGVAGGDPSAQQICLDTQRFGVGVSGIDAAAFLSASNWKAAWYDGKQELYTHMNQVWEDIVWNGDIHPVDKFLQLCELPFTIMRKVTVPIPCEGYYCRALIALAIAVSPAWLAFYFASEHEARIFTTLEGLLYLFCFWLIALTCGGFVLRYAPGISSSGGVTGDAGDAAAAAALDFGSGDVMALGVSGPIALYGFVIAATWIDYVAGHLVSVLDFLGIILHIPGPIIGLTILAWGNSVADLTANITMARKGLANMAMTACFAGPVFNILVGLGLGFSALSAKTGEAETPVDIHIPVVVGFIFILLNTLAILGTGFFFSAGGSGFIPKQYGYLALGLYLTYVISSVALEYREDA